MIVSQDFVWAHIPKTGGDATSLMIQQVPRLIVLADPAADHAKHLGLDHRRGSIEGKLLVANMRKLPAWAVSYARHRERFGTFPDYTPASPHSPDAVAAEREADDMLDDVVGPYEIDVWLRQEHLVDDLVRFLRESAELTSAEEAAIRSVGRVNVDPPRGRLRRLRRDRFFTREQVETLYASNPRWAATERRVYG
jgi:hypothetical protein